MIISKLKNKLADELDVPDSAISKNFEVRISGNRKVYVENIEGILFFDNNLISIKGKVHNLLVKGEGLVIGEITDYYIVINGKIFEVEFKEQ